MHIRPTVLAGAGLALLLAGCGGDSGSGAPTPAPRVLSQPPTSCTYRLGTPYLDDRVGEFSLDLQWFPPANTGSHPVTSYEVEVQRAAVTGTVGPEFYDVKTRRSFPAAVLTVRAKTGTTDIAHSDFDYVSFPACEMVARGEDLSFSAEVRARTAVGLSAPHVCVSADEGWEGTIWYIGHREASVRWRIGCGLTDPQSTHSEESRARAVPYK